MTKSDLRARPVFHHEREAIEAHLTVVFAALAVGRHLHDRAGISIKKLVQTLRGARSATIDINGQRMTLDPNSPTPPAPSSTGSNRVTKASGTSQARRRSVPRGKALCRCGTHRSSRAPRTTGTARSAVNSLVLNQLRLFACKLVAHEHYLATTGD
jgi:hypothetical protein